MTIANQTNRTSAVGSGATGQVVPFSFPISATSDLMVIKRITATGVPTDLTETTNYTISITGDTGGSLTTVTAIETNETIHIVRNTPLTQSLDLEQGGSFHAENLENAIDKNTKLIIENSDSLERTLVFPATDPSSSFANMPNSVDRASKNLTFDSDGKPTASVSIEEGSVTFTDYGKTIAGAANAGTVRDLIELDTDDNVEFAAITGTTGTYDDIITKGPVFDIRHPDFGAVEDGSTNNAVAIQAAIDAAEQDSSEQRGMGVVLIPCVTGLGYMCDADIQIKDMIIITGGGMIKFSGTYGFESNGKIGWTIDGISILGSTTAGQTGIYCHNISGKFWIRNCQFFDLQTGIFATRSYIFKINDNRMWPHSMDNIVNIKLTSGEGNCSKGTAYDKVNAVEISGNFLREYSGGVSPNPIIHIGDSALAPIDPKATNHAKNVHIHHNTISGHEAENAIKIENTWLVTIENNWFERFMGPPVYLGGQWSYKTVVRTNGFWGNDSDDSMDPAIQIDSTIDWNHYSVTISQNVFNQIHANHNYLEADNVIGLVLDDNYGMVQARVKLTNCTGVDLRQPTWVENKLFYDSNELIYENEYLTYTTYL